MSLQRYSPQVEFDHCIAREREERAAAKNADDASVIGAHIVMAERYADRAFALSEEFDLAYEPSGLWKTVAA